MSTLYLIPTSLANQFLHKGILEHQAKQIRHIKHFIVETAKTGRSHLKALELNHPIYELSINELNKHKQNLEQLMKPLHDNYDVGLISDCGMPGVADPGNIVVHEAHRMGINVIILSGPSSLMMALAASGVNGQNFAFSGYIPVNPEKRKIYIQKLNLLINKIGQTQIFIEAPFRNNELLKALIANLDNHIQLSISINLMCDNERTISLPISKWKSSELPNIHKQEVVFIAGIS